MNNHGDKSVLIRIKPQTRAKLHRIRHVGQTLDGIITELIDLWERIEDEKRG